MKSSVKKEWVKALRSGEYDQLEGSLISGDGGSACCLGVLYDTCHDGQWIHRNEGWATQGEYITDYPSMGPCGNVTMPSQTVLKDLELSLTDAETLSEMNDSGESFDDIADWIEKNL